MEFRLLGPVEVRSDREPIELGRRRERVILAILLLEVGRPVPVARLVELLFGDNPPSHPRKAIQVDVSRLRRSLSAVADDEAVRVTSELAGYAIHAPRDAIDVHRFTALTESARETDDVDERHRLLTEALGLWRGPALAELGDSVAIQSVRARLDELRLGAIELRVETELRLGRHAELVAELADLTTQYATSERLVAARMLALYRSGRKRDGLDVYQRAADHLVDELGLDPGPDLRETHLAILRDDAALAAPGPRPAPPAPTVRPAQLPADLPAFTGREDELASLLARSRLPRDTVVISAIDGMAGIGKTALAVHAAHQLAADYPDGQLFIDLNGFTEGVDPVAPGEALARLLRALGVPDAQLPRETDERAALYRSVLADRRALVLLDNAATEDQVEPLFPGAPGCLAIVTSRNRLGGLDSASSLSLDVLPPAEAAALFTRIAGVSRLADEPPGLVDEVVAMCGRLPLAIRIAAARLRSRPAWTLPYLRDRLGDEHRRLAELEAGPRSVAGAFQMSYEQLTEPQARVFRHLGLHPGYDFDTHAAAALAHCSARRAHDLLDGLLDVHLLHQHRPDRYRFHDLLRAYAREMAGGEESRIDLQQALARLFDYYTRAAQVAWTRQYPYDTIRRPSAPTPDADVPTLENESDATTWLDAELANLLLTAAQAPGHDLSACTVRLSHILRRYLHTHSRFAEAKALHTEALTAARDIGDGRGEADALNALGRVHSMQGRNGEAIRCHRLSLDLSRREAYGLGRLESGIGLGRARYRQGMLDDAEQHFREAHELAVELGDPVSEAMSLSGLGDIHVARGRDELAAECAERCLAIYRAVGDRTMEPHHLNALGRIRLRQGQYDAAVRHHEDAVGLARETDSPGVQAQSLHGLGDVYRAQGRSELAARYFRQVVDLGRQVGDRNFQFEGLNGLGMVLRSAGDAEEALARQREALALAHELGQRHDQGRAHEGIAEAMHDLERDREARHHWHKALTIFGEMGVTDAERVRASLQRLDQDAPT
jgi:DNA-binding SARP family transcriptional activator/Flp pilus assembly protein TadD